MCGKLLSADDKYLRYTVSCGLCHSTFVFDSVCIDGNQGTIPVFPPFEQPKHPIEIDSTITETQEQSISQLDAIKTGRLAKAIITYSLEKHLLDEAEIKCFSDSVYTRKRFHFKYPLFQIFPEDSINKASLITKGHNRYYQNPVMIDGKAFFICKEWFDYNRQELLSWGLSKGLTINTILELVEENTNNAMDNGEIRQGISQISGDGRKKANTIVTTDKEASFFKVFNKSVFVIGITIPNELRKTFLRHLSTNDLQNGIPHRVNVRIEDEVYDAYVLKANQKNGCYFWRLQWSKGAPIAVYLQKKYKNIYAALEENPQVTIPSNFGIIVKATEAIDAFEIVCILRMIYQMSIKLVY